MNPGAFLLSPSFVLVQPFSIFAVAGFLGGGHIIIEHTVFGIVFTRHLISLFGVKFRNHIHDDITQIVIFTTERGGLFCLRLGEWGGFGLGALTGADCKNFVGSVHTVLNIRRIVQVLQDPLAESDTILIDVKVGGGVDGEVNDLQGDI